MQTNTFVLYKHTSPTGNVYIGITCQAPEARWQGGLGYRRNEHFFRAILKYGWDNFAHEILAEGLAASAACELERALIAQTMSNDKRYGYNITDGGEHFKHSPASIQKMSAARKGKGLRKLPEETKRKIKENHAGGAECKAVLCVETRIVYDSVNDAARATGVHKGPISRCCSGRPHYNTAGGYHWKWAEIKE